MRILHVVHGYKPAYRVGGPIISVAALAEGLAERGHEVSVFTSNWDLSETMDVPTGAAVRVSGVDVWYFPIVNPFAALFPGSDRARRFSNYIYSPAMARALHDQARGYDIIHTHLPFIFPTSVASRAARRAGVPLCYHQRGVFDPARLQYRSLKKRLYVDLVERKAASRATLFALTQAEVDSYRLLGLTQPAHIIPNGVDTKLYGDAPDPSVLGRLGIGPADRVVLFMGRLHPIKGVDRLIEAFCAAAPALSAAKLVLAGPDELEMRPQWSAMAARAGLADRVCFVGTVTGATKQTLLSRADIFCLPSDAEGFSIAILEALASSTAVLISPRCYFPEVAAAGAGRVVEPTSANLAEAMTELLRNPSMLAEMGRRGLALVRENYDWASIVARVEDVYRLAIAEVGRKTM